ncbi:ATP-binding protein [Shumkonia mesophila]|uniref:ATP-binding protein n=1 Tax=Shumkonia mesophila TaxID=2838854 RepID=UPI002934E92E|nr:ATP-binding protein [Shumkonia mesophila]
MRFYKDVFPDQGQCKLLGKWTSVFASERFADGLLDRLTHRVHILEMNGDSYRATCRNVRSNETPSIISVLETEGVFDDGRSVEDPSKPPQPKRTLCPERPVTQR